MTDEETPDLMGRLKDSLEEHAAAREPVEVMPEAEREVPPDDSCEACSYCGELFPKPVGLHHAEEDCPAFAAQRDAEDDARVAEAEAEEDAGEEVDGEPVSDGPVPEVAPAVDAFLGENAALVPVDPSDQHELMVAMDAHDVELLMRDLLEQVQGAALRKWTYKLPGQGKPEGLTVHATQDIVQRMNWTRKCKIKVLPETLTVDREDVTTENGVEPYYKARIFAEDQVTGSVLPGAAAEAQMMQLKPETADAKRKDGKPIPADNRVFDKFAEWKAIQKATRNALKAFIPQVVEQTILAMAYGKPDRVEPIQTRAEAKAAAAPKPLGTPEAVALEERCKAIYREIRELGDGKGRLAMPPARYRTLMEQSVHSIDALERAVSWLEERKAAVEARLPGGEAEAAAS